MDSFHFDNGDTMPRIGLGTWKSRPGEVHDAVVAAIRAGYRHIDCAHIYGNEAEVGQGLADAMRDGVKREELWITSKLWNDAHDPDRVAPALKNTLQNLGLDYLDLYLMHWPIAHRKGKVMPRGPDDLVKPEAMPPTETWKGMEDCVDAGLTRHIGVSNFTCGKLKRLCDAGRIKPAMVQVELHPYLQQDALLAFCGANGIHVTAYSPLGSGDRPRSMKAADEPVLLDEPVVNAVAERHGVSPAQVLIAWALQRGTAVIPKSVHAERIRQNLASTEVTLSNADMAQIAPLDRGRRYVDGGAWLFPGSGWTKKTLWDD